MKQAHTWHSGFKATSTLIFRQLFLWKFLDFQSSQTFLCPSCVSHCLCSGGTAMQWRRFCLPLSGAYLSYAFVLSREALVHSSLLGSCKSCYHLFKHFFSGWKTTQCLPNAKGPQRILYPPGETPPVSLSLTVKRTTFPNPMTMEGWFPF